MLTAYQAKRDTRLDSFDVVAGGLLSPGIAHFGEPQAPLHRISRQIAKSHAWVSALFVDIDQSNSVSARSLGRMEGDIAERIAADDFTAQRECRLYVRIDSDTDSKRGDKQRFALIDAMVSLIARIIENLFVGSSILSLAAFSIFGFDQSLRFKRV